MRTAMQAGLRLVARPATTILFAALLLVACAGAANAAAKTYVDASVTPQGVAVTTTARIEAPFAVIWQTLTDYDHLAEFVPGMVKSRTLTRCGGTAVVAQTAKAASLLFSYPIDIVVQADEHPPTGISVHILSGNLRTYEGAYHLEPVAGAEDSFVLSWSGIVEPEFILPSFITVWALRQAIEDEFRAMITEIERRETLRRQGLMAFEVIPPAPCSHLARVGRSG